MYFLTPALQKPCLHGEIIMKSEVFVESFLYTHSHTDMTEVAKENFASTLKCFWGLIFITMSLYQAYDFSV